ncbi:MAG: hypothetical protein JW716_04645 [Candidatus Aenigmarchaeota archaeon]|nr:hypothetical protein [Candidatus Aenigmarchaeota archaeon]
MNIPLIFAWVYAAMIATGFWESHAEGKDSWDKGKIGWKIKWRGKVVGTEYHFWLFIVCYPLFITLPLVIAGFTWRLFGILMSAYLSGLIIEDIFWYISNPKFNLKEWGPKKVTWFKWVGIGKFKLPINYIVCLAFAVILWILFWA